MSKHMAHAAALQPVRDRDLGMDRAMTRRDFLNGVAIGAGTIMGNRWLPGLDAQNAGPYPQDAPGYYPPALTGMRGSHDGSFEVSHRLRDALFWAATAQPINTGESYDL